ncbi:GNAT family N-acetyltransferase [Mucilaginibacter jinjuensis]|uniref:GNAT family N-acetyltransferase n=1 Tax=Mucilaginibacter jinjuensis TaxID=1176721 RepID=A0ABY7TDN7_9SPHI|nr:GNAT family N-acetyltransferase [Mucilaginibacter jinjuensis]WCT14625.1 GNAT family N-acetyltransferase [Mucilaginibacter jinjuensis]
MSNQFIVRDAITEDVSQLSTLITQLGYPCTGEEVQIRFDSVSQNSDYRTLVIIDGNAVIGMAGLVKGFWYEKNGTYVRILAFVVNEEYRGQGVGKQLIKSVEDWAVELGCNAVILSSGNRDERIGAHHFYKGLGYEIKSSGFIKQL